MRESVRQSAKIGFFAFLSVIIPIQGRAATFVWNGGGVTANWSNGTNWAGGIAPTNNGTAAIVLAGTAQLAPNVDTNWDISSLTFSNSAGGFVLGGSALNIRSGGVTNSSASGQIISNAITLWTNQTWNALAGNLTFSGDITNTDATNLLTVTGGFNSSIGGVISGTGGIIKLGTGTNVLSGANTYSGLTAVSAGVMNLQNSSALGSGSGNTTVTSGAQLQLLGGITVTGKTLTVSGTGLANSGAIRNIGGSNSWSGTITLGAASTVDSDAGTLNLGGNIVNSTFAATFTNVGTIILNGALGSGSGGLVKIGTGTLQLGGANTYTGTTTVGAGTVQYIASGSGSSATAVTVNAGGTMDLNGYNESILSLAGAGSVTTGGGILTVNNGAASTFSGVMSGAGALTKAGTATFTMSGVNTYSGGTTISNGAISIAGDGNLGNTNGALTLNGGTLTLAANTTSARSVVLGSGGGTISGNFTLTLSGVISGPGALTKLGTKVMTITGTNTYLGGTTNGAGTISIASDANLGDPSGPLTFSAAATLTTTASSTSTRNVVLGAGTATFSCGTGFTNAFNGVISGAGPLTQSGAGVMVLGGNNTFTNLLTISKGTVRFGTNGGISALAPVVITATTATLDLNGFNGTIGSLASTAAGKVTLGNGFLTAGGDNLSTTNSAVISGNGGFTFAGAGKMILTGANTYTNTTTVASGTLKLGKSSSLASTSPLVVSNGATFNMTWNTTNYSQTVASLAGAGSVVLGTTLTAGNTSTTTFSGTISGAGAFTKVGTGTQILSGTNTYSGATTVSVGNLQVNGNSVTSAVTIASAATLSGSGTVGTVAVNSGATNSPGAGATGTLASGAETWAGGGHYFWEINDAAGTKGGTDGWDWLNISGALNITANSGSKFNLKIVSLTPANAAGVVTNFDNTLTYIWTIASASGGISGFSTASFSLDTTAFQNPFGAGSFALSQSGNDLNLIFTSAAQAAVKEVQSGTLTSTGNGTNTATLGVAVNPTNAFLIFNTRHNSSVPGGSMIRGRIASSNSVEFVRATTETSTMNIQWYLIEYSAGVRVQRGEVNQTNTIINVPLSPVSAVNQAFVTWSKTPDPAETAFTDSDPVVGEITTTSNLQFHVTSAPSSAPVISWQVIEFQNPASIGVQSGSVTNMTGTNLLATVTLPGPVNTNSTFLLTGYRTSGSGTGIGARMLRAQLTGASTLTFDRDISGAPDDVSEIEWQAVQLNDGSYVQSGSVNFTNGIAETNVTIVSLDTNRAAVFASVQPAGGQNTGRSPSTGGILGVGSATLAMTSATQVTMDRNNTSDQADVGWQVVGFGPGSLLTPATGGGAISADTTSNAYTSLTGPVYTEIQSGNVGTGTIFLRAPAGFNFNTNAPQPSVLITRVGGSGANSLNINGVASGSYAAMTTVNKTNLTFTVASASSGGVMCSLTWTNISVRPTAGTPLASGNLVSLGTSTIQGVTTNSTGWGFLAEVVGTNAQIAISTAPSSAVTAGVDFPQQPVIQIEDQFGNLCAADNTDVVAAVSSGTDTNDVNGSMTVVGGVAAFSGLDYSIAQTNTITFSVPGLPSKTSGNIVVSAAAASQVSAVTDASAMATAGVPFDQQPVVQIQDQFGNLRKTDNSTVVVASIGVGSGSLFGTQTNTAVNGVVTFTDLSYQVAETITIVYAASGLAMDNDSVVVGAAPASQLVIQTEPSAVATAGVPFAQQPMILLEDQFGNLCATNNSTVVTASRDAGSGVLQGGVNITASGGVATFTNLSHNVATTISVDFNSSGLTGATSSSISVSPAAAAALAFATPPGSATVGSIFDVQPVVVTQDAYGNNSISGLANSLSVLLALTSGTGALLGATNLDVGTSAGDGTVSFTDLEIDFAGSKQLTANAVGMASAVSASFSVAQAGTSVSVSSSENPSGFKDSVTLTATLPSAATGNVTFLTNSVVFSTNSLTDGATSAATTLLPRGTNTITVQYAGDSNYLGSTNSLAVGQIVTNHPPVASVTTYTRTAGLRLLIAKSDLTNYWTDVDGDAVALTGINLVTTNNVNLSTNGTYILYTNATNVNDQFTYSISDGQGGTNTGVINVTINPFVTGQQSGSITTVGSSTTVTFYGIPGFSYVTQRSTNLVSWASISTNTVPTNGVITVTDTFSDLGVVPASAYYRLGWSP